jgi:hypothetical protein
MMSWRDVFFGGPELTEDMFAFKWTCACGKKSWWTAGQVKRMIELGWADTRKCDCGKPIPRSFFEGGISP